MLPRPTTVLVVDDEPDIRTLLTTLLAMEGYAALSASDHEQALALFNANEVDLVIVDLLMPGQNGVTLLKQFKQRRPEVRSIIYSGVLERTSIAPHVGRLTELADCVVVKPASNEALLGQVRTLLGKR